MNKDRARDPDQGQEERTTLWGRRMAEDEDEGKRKHRKERGRAGDRVAVGEAQRPVCTHSLLWALCWVPSSPGTGLMEDRPPLFLQIGAGPCRPLFLFLTFLLFSSFCI